MQKQEKVQLKDLQKVTLLYFYNFKDENKVF